MEWGLGFKQVKVDWSKWAWELREVGLKVAFERCLREHQPKSAQGWFGAVVATLRFTSSAEIPTLDEEVNVIDACLQNQITKVCSFAHMH